MRKLIAMLSISALIVSGGGSFIPVDTVFAGQLEELSETDEENLGENLDDSGEVEETSKESDEDFIEEILEDDKLPQYENESTENMIREKDKINKEPLVDDIQIEKQDLVEAEGKVCLQVPQQLKITLDPFEINGMGQIYSDQYVIKNLGEKAGVLMLSELVCIPGEESGIIIKTNRKEIHKADKKLLYIEIKFNNGDEVILSSEGNWYEIRLEPGEELTFSYSGEINENADQCWEEHDVTIGMKYSWIIEKDIFENTSEDKANYDYEINKPEWLGDYDGRK